MTPATASSAELPIDPNERVAPAPGARQALILLLVINLFNYIDRYILAAVAEPVREEFGVSYTAMGWLSTAFLLSYMVTSPIFGWMADRFPRWALIGVGVILWSLASGASGLAHFAGVRLEGYALFDQIAVVTGLSLGYLFLLVMRCLIGVGEGAYGPVAPTLLADLYPVAIRGRIMAWFYAAIPVGSALGFVLGGLFASRGNWHWAFLLTLPPGILLGIWCLRMKEPPRGLSDSATPHRKATLSDYVTLVRTPSYVLNCLAMTSFTFAMGGISFWMPTYLKTERGLSESVATPTFGGIVVVSGLFATILGGIAGDKLRERGWGGAYFIVSAAGMLLGFPLLLLMLVVDFPYAWGILAAAVFCLFFNTGPSNTALANVTHPSIRATAFAMNIFIIHAFGDAISPPIIGWVKDHWSFKVGFVVVSLTILLSGIFWAWGSIYLKRDTDRAPHLLDEEQSTAPRPA
ncbi:MAG TPA: MFS transporter [Tepidisphaeraceae bacterium]|jgi:MFS family permease|nr:MFS transporter [Tepidisphaeraceae bacterium]